MLQFLSIDEQQKKLPFNSPYLEFSFSQDIDSATITSSDISFSPHVDGTLEVVHGNTLRYKFEESLQIDEVYTVTLQDTIKNTKGKRLDKVYEYDITAVSAAKVVFVSPE
ncbi:Ig-like domain-containing protein [bacterium]|nr:Ig-like domain-containing protein [bacterium]